MHSAFSQRPFTSKQGQMDQARFMGGHRSERFIDFGKALEDIGNNLCGKRNISKGL